MKLSMKYTYSVTVNVAPFMKLKCFTYIDKKISEDTFQYHKLTQESQKKMLLHIITRLADKLKGEWGHYTLEPTKRNDLHYHGTAVLEHELNETDLEFIKGVSKEYGNPKYNEVIKVELCHDGGVAWHKYMHKLEQTEIEKVPEFNAFKINNNKINNQPIGSLPRTNES